MLYKDFRAWDSREERYIYHIQRCLTSPQNTWSCTRCFWDYLSDKDCVVEESIGLKDENGHELYENDLVEGIVMNSFSFKGQVVRKANAFVVKLNSGDLLSKLPSYHLKKIGNIHTTKRGEK